jgi:proteasome lid subunit RPN8/RPN11
MVEQAQAERPRECCGVLAGRFAAEAGGVVLRVAARYPLINAAANPEREYWADSQSLLAAIRSMRALRLEIVGIYHSHPASAAVPSRTDRERNYYPEAVHFIISLAGSEPDVQAWWIVGDQAEKAAWERLG